jgi:23S rRNA (adenine2503-C2)-methyltransferase
VQYQWTLLEGINDGDDEIDGIVDLLKGKYAVLNMIPYNTIPDLHFRRPSWDKARAIAGALHRRGVLTKLRDSAGQEVDGGCGQLRARAAGGLSAAWRPALRPACFSACGPGCWPPREKSPAGRPRARR